MKPRPTPRAWPGTCLLAALSIGILNVTPALADSPTGDPRATVTLHPGTPSVPYSRMLFGGFLEHFDGQIYGGVFEPGSPRSDARGFRRDVIEALKELKVPVVRWPGGCFASGYHWKDGVGRDRKPVPDPVWGVVDPNTFGTDEFVEFCRLIDAEPYICTNAGNGTPEEMREWVEYCNATEGPWARLRAAGGHERPHAVRYWSIGNENWGGHEIGASTPEKWGPLVARSAELMLQADPKLVLLAAATPDRGWTLPLLRAAGERLQYVCIHEYWLGLWQQNDRPGYLPCVLLSEGPDRTLRGTHDILREAGALGRIRIAFDEWNLRGWHHPGFPRKEVQDLRDPTVAALIARREENAVDAQYTMADALFSASFLNACLRHADDVGMANIAPLVNTRGPLHVHPGGIVKRTTFHALAMYASLLENRVGQSEVESGNLTSAGRSVATVDALATVDEAGRNWAIALVNRDPEKTVSCAIRVGDKPVTGSLPATILSGDSPDAFNGLERPTRVVPEKEELKTQNGTVQLRAHSLTILRIIAQ